MPEKRYYSHRENPVHRTILCGLFRLGRGSYRHRRESMSPLLRLFGIRPRRTEYRQNQYYARDRRSQEYGYREQRGYSNAPQHPGPRANVNQAGYQSREPQRGQPQTIAERRAAEYRQRTGQQQGYSQREQGYAQRNYPQQGYTQQGYAPPHQAAQSASGYSQQSAYQPQSYAPGVQHATRGHIYHQQRPNDDGKVHSNLEVQSHGNQKFQPLPRPTGRPPYHLALESVLPPDHINTIHRSGRLMLHMTGDTGGVKTPESQQIVAMGMETHFGYPDVSMRPAFFYHLGDVAYFFGEAKEYYPQFYDAYVHYPAPIFAIPGNHDGDVTDGSPPSLTAFVNNFCAPTPHLTPEAGETERTAMTQPNVYWTLEAPYLTVVGLWTNVPEGGRIDQDQLQWFINELRTAPTDKALFVTAHHPLFSADSHHSGSAYMLKTMTYAFQQAGRIPDAIFAGHVHNFQRFTWELNGRHIPYIVAGAGGYWHLHYMARQPDGNKLVVPYRMQDAAVTLENYCDDRHGFMRLMVTPQQVVAEYFASPRPHESWRSDPERVDGWVLDLRSHKLTHGTDLK